MKAHKNIDELFKQKLTETKRQPAADAWSKLQNRLPEQETEKKRAYGFWYFAAAAVVSLLLISSGIYFSNTPNKNLAATKVKQKPAPQFEFKTENKPQLAYEQTQVAQPDYTAASETAISPLPAETEKKTSTAVKAKTSVKKAVENLNKKTKQKTSDAKEIKPEKQKHRPTFPGNPAAELMASATPEKSTENTKSVTNDLPQETKAAWGGGPIEIVILSSAQQPDKAEEAVAKAEQQEKPKFKLVKNIVKQAINVKNGEQVDLQELGLANRIAFETKIGNQKISKEINL